MEETTHVETTSRLRVVGNALLVPALAILTAILIGSVLMLLTGDNPIEAYVGLFQGAFGSVQALSRTIRKATPFIFTGLSVAFAFKAGLFNIGASGQFLMGTVFSVAVGVNFEGLPFIIHMPLALLAGVLGGALWGAIPGFLKAWRGAHEVITTIMLNYVAANFVGWTVYAGGTEDKTPGRWPTRRRLLAQSRRPGMFLQVPAFPSSCPTFSTGCTGDLSSLWSWRCSSGGCYSKPP
jgi:ABC-type uncharacterized transport system permease subunit